MERRMKGRWRRPGTVACIGQNKHGENRTFSGGGKRGRPVLMSSENIVPPTLRHLFVILGLQVRASRKQNKNKKYIPVYFYLSSKTNHYRFQVTFLQSSWSFQPFWFRLQEICNSSSYQHAAAARRVRSPPSFVLQSGPSSWFPRQTLKTHRHHQTRAPPTYVNVHPSDTRVTINTSNYYYKAVLNFHLVLFLSPLICFLYLLKGQEIRQIWIR